MLDRCFCRNWLNSFYTFIGKGEDTEIADSMRCYRDGSFRERASGSSLAAYRGNQPEPTFTACAYTGIATVFQSELHAIQIACTYASMHADRLIVILSDSQSAIQAVSNPLITSRTVLQTTEALNDLVGQGKEVCLQWVRRHNGTKGNVLADIMANEE
jgi:ribonuclease HI